MTAPSIAHLNQSAGCLLGLATGDALGARYEGGPIERLLWLAIGRTRDGHLRWTDDTQMTLDLAASLLEQGTVHPDAIAKRFADSYRWSRGYGPGAARFLKRIRRGEHWERASRAVYPEGSYGNGAAMRAPVLALFFAHDQAQLVDATRRSAQVTHAHPLGVEGAILIALASQGLFRRAETREVLDTVRSACIASDFSDRLQTVERWLEENSRPPPREVARRLGNGMTAPTSCPTALYIALRHIREPFESMMQFIIGCRGDVDTIGAMAGALWGIYNGSEGLPAVRLERRAAIIALAARIDAVTMPDPHHGCRYLLLDGREQPAGGAPA